MCVETQDSKQDEDGSSGIHKTKALDPDVGYMGNDNEHVGLTLNSMEDDSKKPEHPRRSSRLLQFYRRLRLGLGRLQLVTRRTPLGRVLLGALKPSLNLILSPKPRHDLLYFNIFRLIITFTSASCTSRPYSFTSQALLLHSPPSPTPSRPACSAPTSWLRSA